MQQLPATDVGGVPWPGLGVPREAEVGHSGPMEIENEDEPSADGRVAPRPPNRFKHLPTRVLPADLVEDVVAEPASDPNFGRDPNHEALYG